VGIVKPPALVREANEKVLCAIVDAAGCMSCINKCGCAMLRRNSHDGDSVQGHARSVDASVCYIITRLSLQARGAFCMDARMYHHVLCTIDLRYKILK
jgi:hypothetical protein